MMWQSRARAGLPLTSARCLRLSRAHFFPARILTQTSCARVFSSRPLAYAIIVWRNKYAVHAIYKPPSSPPVFSQHPHTQAHTLHTHEQKHSSSAVYVCSQLHVTAQAASNTQLVPARGERPRIVFACGSAVHPPITCSFSRGMCVCSFPTIAAWCSMIFSRLRPCSYTRFLRFCHTYGDGIQRESRWSHPALVPLRACGSSAEPIGEASFVAQTWVCTRSAARGCVLPWVTRKSHCHLLLRAAVVRCREGEEHVICHATAESECELAPGMIMFFPLVG